MTALLLASALLLPCQAPTCANGTCPVAGPVAYSAPQSVRWATAPFPYHGQMLYDVPVARPEVKGVRVRTTTTVRVKQVVRTRVRGAGMFGLRLGGRRAVQGGCR